MIVSWPARRLQSKKRETEEMKDDDSTPHKPARIEVLCHKRAKRNEDFESTEAATKSMWRQNAVKNDSTPNKPRMVAEEKWAIWKNERIKQARNGAMHQSAKQPKKRPTHL